MRLQLTDLCALSADLPAAQRRRSGGDVMNTKEVVTILLSAGCYVEGGEKPGQFLVDGRQFTTDDLLTLALKIRQQQKR